jgi:hypothetical protein
VLTRAASPPAKSLVAVNGLDFFPSQPPWADYPITIVVQNFVGEINLSTLKVLNQTGQIVKLRN